LPERLTLIVALGVLAAADRVSGAAWAASGGIQNAALSAAVIARRRRPRWYPNMGVIVVASDALRTPL
jgi:hypothetical protein